MSLANCAFRGAVRPAAFARNVRPFSGGRPLKAMGEDDIHKDHEHRKAEIDSHKEDSVSKQKEGKAHWKRELATSSEAAVKADQEDLDASKGKIEKLQKETEDLLHKKS